MSADTRLKLGVALLVLGLVMPVGTPVKGLSDQKNCGIPFEP